MVQIEYIGQGTRLVQIAINLSTQELAALTGFIANVQKPSGAVLSLNLPLSSYQNGILSFEFDFFNDGDFTVQTTLVFGAQQVTSNDSLVLRVQNPIKTPAIEPQGQFINKQDICVYLGEEALAEASDRRNGVTDDNQKIQQAIDYAESMVLSFAAKNYLLPITCADGSIPTPIKQICIFIAVWMLYERRRTEEVNHRYEEAMAMLDRLAKGQINLICASGQMALKPTSAALDGVAVFASSQKLKGFCDSDKNCGGW